VGLTTVVASRVVLTFDPETRTLRTGDGLAVTVGQNN
jgi:hypothetical protein